MVTYLLGWAELSIVAMLYSNARSRQNTDSSLSDIQSFMSRFKVSLVVMLLTSLTKCEGESLLCTYSMVLKLPHPECAINGTNLTDYRVGEQILFYFEYANECGDNGLKCSWNCSDVGTFTSYSSDTGNNIATATIAANLVTAEGQYTLRCSDEASYTTVVTVIGGESTYLLFNNYAKQALL